MRKLVFQGVLKTKVDSVAFNYAPQCETLYIYDL